MNPPDDKAQTLYWLHRVMAAARAAFVTRRTSGDLAMLVHDSLLDSGATPSEHYLRFEGAGLTLHIRVAAGTDHISLSGRVEPRQPRTAVLQSARRESPLRSTVTQSGLFTFPWVSHGLVRMRLESPEHRPVWSDWFRV